MGPSTRQYVFVFSPIFLPHLWLYWSCIAVFCGPVCRHSRHFSSPLLSSLCPPLNLSFCSRFFSFPSVLFTRFCPPLLLVFPHYCCPSILFFTVLFSSSIRCFSSGIRPLSCPVFSIFVLLYSRSCTYLISRFRLFCRYCPIPCLSLLVGSRTIDCVCVLPRNFAAIRLVGPV